MRYHAVPLILAVLSCTESPPPDTPRTTIDTVGTVVHVVNAGDPPAWKLEPALRIGSPEEGPDAFGLVTSVLLDDDGYVFVGDMHAHHIQIFDAQGRYVRTIGREGRGPGEFTRVWSLAWVGDTLAVMDPDAARIGLLTHDGEWVGLWRYQRICCGGIMLYRASPTKVYSRMWLGDGEAYVQYTPAGPSDTLPEPEYQGELISGTRCELAGGDGMTYFEIPFAPQYLHAPAPDGTIATVLTDRYQFAFITAAGDIVRVVDREYVNLPISDSEWEDGGASFREFLETWGKGSHCDPPDLQRPETKPALRSFFFDPAGRMWVEVYAHTGFAYEVFDAEGRLIGIVPLPPRDARVEPYVRGDRMVLVEQDSLDVQYVRVFDIRPQM
jgi:hypothetical protein